MLTQKGHFKYNDINKLKAKEQEKIYYTNIIQNKTGVVYITKCKKPS